MPMAGTTIIHQTIGEQGASRVLIKPAAPGTGVIAGGAVRQILEAAGIRDVLAKSLGSPTHVNVARATINALFGQQRPDADRPAARQDGGGSHPAGAARRLPHRRDDAGPARVRVLTEERHHMADDKTLRITLVRSTIGEKPKTRACVRTLGLRRIRHTVERPDSPEVRGLIARVRHLVEVEES